MKKQYAILILLSSFFLSKEAISQITLHSTDMPAAGWKQHRIKDTICTGITVGAKGANQVWNFSTLHSHVTDSVNYLALTGSQSTNFPTANLAITSDNVNIVYSKTTSTLYDYEGIEGTTQGVHSFLNFNPVSDVYHFPTTYGGAFNGTYAYTKTVSGSSVGQPAVQNVRITGTANYIDSIDGWGKLITPIGRYKSIRQHRIEYSHVVIEAQAYVTNTWSTVSDTRDTSYVYSYLTQETKGPAATATLNKQKVLTNVIYSLIPPAIPTPNYTFVTGVHGGVVFTDSTDGYPDRYHWSFGNGDTSNAVNPVENYAANGTYYVCETVYNASGSHTYCDSVHISTIVGITEVALSNVRLYPNPTNNVLTIDMQGNTEEATTNLNRIEFINQLGQVVMTVNESAVQNKMVQTNLQQLSLGTYLASLVTNDGIRKQLGRFTITR